MRPRYHSAKTVFAPLAKLRNEGVAVTEVLAGTGLSLSILERPDQRIRLSQEIGFLRNLRRLQGDAGVGLYIGSCYPLSVFGLYGYALMSASTARDALRLAYEFVELSFAFHEHRIRVDQGLVEMSMSGEDYDVDDRPMLNEREMAATFMILRGLFGEAFCPDKVCFKHRKQVDMPRYREVFGVAPQFDAPVNALYFPASLLDLPLLQCDQDTAALCLARCVHLRARLRAEDCIVDDVRERLLRHPGKFPSIDSVAKAMNLSGRTLRRRLRSRGSGYQNIVDELRFDLARDYLQTTQMSVTQIALLLGYSDGAHFSYAFKRWAGCPPGQFRSGGSPACRR